MSLVHLCLPLHCADQSLYHKHNFGHSKWNNICCHIRSCVCSSTTRFLAGLAGHAAHCEILGRGPWLGNDSPSVECKCWKLSCEHTALSVICHFLVSSQELYFLSFHCCSLLQACHCTRIIFKKKLGAHTHTHARMQMHSQATRYYGRRKIWQTAQWRGTLVEADAQQQRKASRSSLCRAGIRRSFLSAAVFTQGPWHSGPVNARRPLTTAWSSAKAK